MTFTEQWFCQQSQDRLAVLAATITDIPGDVVEIGSWEGRSTIALANAVAPRIVHAVDTWNGSPDEISSTLAAERDIYATFLKNTAGLNIEPFRQGWRDYALEHDGPVAFLFIDAEHTYREVFDNIQTFLPRMVSGGVICGDDQHHPPVRRALIECFPAKDVEIMATVWSWRKP